VSPDLHRTDIILQRRYTCGTDARDDLEFSLTTPSNIPLIKPIKMYWDERTTFIITLGRPKKIGFLRPEAVDNIRRTTNLIQRAVHSDRNPDHGNDFIALFAPKIKNGDMAKWLELNQGRSLALDHFRTQPRLPCRGFVRTPSLFGHPYIFQNWRVQEISPQESLVEVECVPLPRRRHFLHQATLSKGLLQGLEPSEAERRCISLTGRRSLFTDG
jgi:hypothetical protein